MTESTQAVETTEAPQENLMSQFFDDVILPEPSEGDVPPVDDASEAEESAEEEEAELEAAPATEEEKPAAAGRKARWEREAERARKSEAERAEWEKRYAVLESEHRNLSEAMRVKLSGKTDEQVTDDQKDNFLRQNGFDPDNIVDKDTVIQILQNSGKTMQTVDDLRSAMVSNSIKSSITAAKAALPDMKNAMEHFANTKAEEFAMLASLNGAPISKEEAQQKALSAASALMINATERGVDPATALYNYAKSIGYVAKKALPKGDEIDINKLNELRNNAGKPAYEVASVNSKSGDSYQAELSRRGMKYEDFFDA